jgi:hypothetical protein
LLEARVAFLAPSSDFFPFSSSPDTGIAFVESERADTRFQLLLSLLSWLCPQSPPPPPPLPRPLLPLPRDKVDDDGQDNNAASNDALGNLAQVGTLCGGTSSSL